MSEVELHAEPIEAYKLARLTLVDGKVRFAPLHRRDGEHATYENPGRAKCAEGHEHHAPERACTCGFYAVNGREELWRLGWQTLETATLRVLLHGRIIEHQHGWRAANQEVATAEISNRCWWCGEEGRVLGRRSRRQRYLATSCERCAKHDRTSLEVAATDLGCSIVLGTESEAKASTKTERAALLVQTVPGVVIATAACAIAILTKVGEIAGVGGLIAGGWLVPGRALAEKILDRGELSVRERHRVIARSGGRALFAAIGSWAIAGLIAVVYAPKTAAMLAVVPPSLWSLTGRWLGL